MVPATLYGRRARWMDRWSSTMPSSLRSPWQAPHSVTRVAAPYPASVRTRPQCQHTTVVFGGRTPEG